MSSMQPQKPDEPQFTVDFSKVLGLIERILIIIRALQAMKITDKATARIAQSQVNELKHKLSDALVDCVDCHTTHVKLGRVKGSD